MTLPFAAVQLPSAHLLSTLPTELGDEPKKNPRGDKPGSRSRKTVCKCSFIIRVAKSTLEQTTIRCEMRREFVLA